jgi:hypothetical protein
MARAAGKSTKKRGGRRHPPRAKKKKPGLYEAKAKDARSLTEFLRCPSPLGRAPEWKLREVEGRKTMANNFVLKGSGVEVDYTIGASPSLPALSYKHGAFYKSFKPNEIRCDDTGLGKLVSVALGFNIDAGGERFGFFLPFADVSTDHTAGFHTFGIYETFSGPNSVAHRPSTGRCIEMSGTAQTVTVPTHVGTGVPMHVGARPDFSGAAQKVPSGLPSSYAGKSMMVPTHVGTGVPMHVGAQPDFSGAAQKVPSGLPSSYAGKSVTVPTHVGTGVPMHVGARQDFSGAAQKVPSGLPSSYAGKSV